MLYFKFAPKLYTSRKAVSEEQNEAVEDCTAGLSQGLIEASVHVAGYRQSCLAFTGGLIVAGYAESLERCRRRGRLWGIRRWDYHRGHRVRFRGFGCQ